MKNQSTFNQILNTKFLKIYRKTDNDSNSIYSNYSSFNDGLLFSLNHILDKYSKNRSYLIDKVFEIKLDDESESAEFRFVHLKAS